MSAPRLSSSQAGARPREIIFSSCGTRWAGLEIEASRLQAGRGVREVNSENLIVSILSTAGMTWTARGARHKCQFRPGSTVFLKEGYSLDNLTGSNSVSGVRVFLQESKISELGHDDLRTSRADLLAACRTRGAWDR
jgi:hypothetical protein